MLRGIITHRQRLIRSISTSQYCYKQPRKVLTLFGKEGCGLCDRAKQVMMDIIDSEEFPQKNVEFKYVDISDVMNTHWWDKYCFDVPVLHIDDTKGERVKMMHRLDGKRVWEEIERE